MTDYLTSFMEAHRRFNHVDEEGDQVELFKDLIQALDIEPWVRDVVMGFSLGMTLHSLLSLYDGYSLWLSGFGKTTLLKIFFGKMFGYKIIKDTSDISRGQRFWHLDYRGVVAFLNRVVCMDGGDLDTTELYVMDLMNKRNSCLTFNDLSLFEPRIMTEEHEMSPVKREQLITNYCEECQNKIFGGDGH